MLALTLPLAVLVSSQLRIHCVEQGECSAPVQVGAWLLLPLVIVWLVVVLVLAVRVGRLMRGADRDQR